MGWFIPFVTGWAACKILSKPKSRFVHHTDYQTKVCKNDYEVIDWANIPYRSIISIECAERLNFKTMIFDNEEDAYKWAQSDGEVLYKETSVSPDGYWVNCSRYSGWWPGMHSNNKDNNPIYKGSVEIRRPEGRSSIHIAIVNKNDVDINVCIRGTY